MATEEEVVDEGTPEEGKEQIIEDLLYCFLNEHRECGAGCMAYVTFPRVSKNDELNPSQRRCLLLSGVEKTARHVTILAQMMSESHRFRKTKEQDKERAQSLGTGPFASPFPLPKKDPK